MELSSQKELAKEMKSAVDANDCQSMLKSLHSKLVSMSLSLRCAG